MARRPWTTEVQETWLRSHLIEYRTARRNGNRLTNAFFACTTGAYVREFPFVEGAEGGCGSTVSGVKMYRKHSHYWSENPKNDKLTGNLNSGIRVSRLRGEIHRRVDCRKDCCERLDWCIKRPFWRSLRPDGHTRESRLEGLNIVAIAHLTYCNLISRTSLLSLTFSTSSFDDGPTLLDHRVPGNLVEEPRAKKTNAFFIRTEAAYFKEFPFVEGAEDGRGATFTGAKSRVREWFSNHGRKSNFHRPSTRIKVLKLRQKKASKKSPWQVYSGLYYNNKLKPVIDHQYTEHVEKSKADNTEPEKAIAFRNRLIKEAYEAESDAVKAEVEVARERLLDNISIVPPASMVEGLDGDLANLLGRNLGLAKNIEALPVTLQTLCEEVERQTGWEIHIWAGGPNVAENGKIRCFRVSAGSTKVQSAKDFATWHGELDKAITDPLVRYLHIKHPRLSTDVIHIAEQSTRDLWIVPPAPGPSGPTPPSNDATTHVGLPAGSTSLHNNENDEPKDDKANQSEEESGSESSESDEHEHLVTDNIGTRTSPQTKSHANNKLDKLTTLSNTTISAGAIDVREDGSTTKETIAAMTPSETTYATAEISPAKDLLSTSTPTRQTDLFDLTPKQPASDNGTTNNDATAAVRISHPTTPAHDIAMSPANDATADEPVYPEELSDCASNIMDVKPWINKGYDDLRLGTTSVASRRLAALWLKLEVVLNHSESAKGLPSTGRPVELAEYLKRKDAVAPEITDASEFGIRWRNYYTSIQVAIRNVSTWPPSQSKSDSTVWSPLLKGGRRGLFSLLISLSWWQKFGTTRTQRLLVEEAVKDAHWLFSQLFLAATEEYVPEQLVAKVTESHEGSRPKRSAKSIFKSRPTNIPKIDSTIASAVDMFESPPDATTKELVLEKPVAEESDDHKESRPKRSAKSNFKSRSTEINSTTNTAVDSIESLAGTTADEPLPEEPTAKDSVSQEGTRPKRSAKSLFKTRSTNIPKIASTPDSAVDVIKSPLKASINVAKAKAKKIATIERHVFYLIMRMPSKRAAQNIEAPVATAKRSRNTAPISSLAGKVVI
ncbi:hypothetical protein BD410DRAFT_803858 [Rickenella mellea]|uniref:Uncharacterized protein n=1 Tax=Rickenella mellea TaxID=50990 RepID=A0A4Y7Q3T0_9AGAM|nr:hypothetical protein BD410DRAFT_803858 [Rickenella mellea]